MTYKRQLRLLLLTLVMTAMAYTAAFAEEEQVPLTPQNGVPLVIIYVNETQSDIDTAQKADPKNEYGNIAQMNDSERHTVRAIGEAEIIVPEGYQVQLATNKGFTKGKKTISIKGYKKTSRKISGLKKNKKYYVRIRTYKKIQGKRLCSNWSKAQSVKTGK